MVPKDFLGFLDKHTANDITFPGEEKDLLFDAYTNSDLSHFEDVANLAIAEQTDSRYIINKDVENVLTIVALNDKNKEIPVFRAEYNPETKTTNFSCTYHQEHETFLIKMISALKEPLVKKCPNIDFALKLLQEMNDNKKPIKFDEALVEKLIAATPDKAKGEALKAALEANQQFIVRERSSSTSSMHRKPF